MNVGSRFSVRQAALLCLLLAVPMLRPSPALAAACGGSNITYVETGNGGDVTEFCGGFRGWGFCEQPVVGAPAYSLNSPGCSPYFGACSMTAIFSAEFPGNHQNDPSDIGFGYSYATVELYSLGGTLIGSCGVPGGPIVQDFGTVTVTGGANCSNPGPGRRRVLAIMCKGANPASCQKIEELFLDFNLAAGCIEPPFGNCGAGDSECRDCTPGGIGVGGEGAGVGGPGSPATGPEATLRYTAGGAGRAGLPGSAAWNVALGRYWSHDYAERIIPLPDESRIWMVTQYGTFREWSSPDAGGVYRSVKPSSEYRVLTWLNPGWELRELDGTVHSFGGDGRWLSTTDRNGNAKTATYGASGELLAVDFPDGRREDFGYDPGTGKLASITEVGIDGLTTSVWSYTWTGDDLTRIDRPDGTALLFSYGDVRHPGYLTLLELEGTDGVSVRVLRGYEYDDEANVTRTWKGDLSPTGPDAVDVWSAAFDDPTEPTVTTVTPPVGGPITYEIARDTVSKKPKVLSISGDCPTCGLGPNSQLFYEDPDHPLLPTRIVDGRGTATLLSYDAFGQVTSRTEAMGETEERITTWTYDPTFPALVTSIEQPSVAGGASMRTTGWLLDASGNALERTITGVEAGSAFTHTTTTSYNAAGRPLTIDPPGHGTADQTSFTYDPARGDLFPLTREDPLPPSGTMTTSFGYDVFNRRTSVTDPNGVETTTAYDPLDRVTEIRQLGASPPADDLVTSHSYSVFGELFRTTLPRGNVIEYGYDAAGRLVSVERKPDASTPGERVLYTLDAAGNRTLEELQRWDASAAAWVTHSSTAYEYSTRCQVDRIVQAPGSPEEAVTEFSYTCNGHLAEQWDPNHDAAVDPPTTSYTYDLLDRLTAVSQPWAAGGSAVTTYAYDVQDHLVAVTDAEGNTTTYDYSDRDLLTQEVSPVSGTTTHGYDEHGELVTTTDSRGITVSRTVDPLDRVTLIDYPGTDLDVSYTYDAEPVACGGTSFEIGRLGAITRSGQAVEYCYDRFGRTTKDGELAYLYDANGNRTGIVYPGGVSATYGIDFADREVSLDVITPGGIGAEPVVSAATYLPSGPLSTLRLGSGTTETRAFDGRYAPTAIALAGPVERTFTYTTDLVGNVLEIVEQGACTPGPVVLENQTVTTEETFTSCTTIEAGNEFRIESPGDVTFNAQGAIALKDGFSVGSGARFVAGSGEIPPLSIRTYTYQGPQYFLTSADGPWGELDWSYDRIGNRLSEARDGGSPDVYQYLLNAGTGNTPILDQILLGVGGTRDYTWGAAGHLEEVAAGANVIDFASDAEGRLSGVTRTAAAETAAFGYDGWSYLRSATETAGGSSSVESFYDSTGIVHALRRQPSPTDPQELVGFFYLAGRPVAQLAIDGAATETWTYLTTDDLGTPFLATDDTGSLVWEGGFEPFGRDYQQGTPAGALENHIYLRLPGQWEDTSWGDSTSGAEITYNVARWIQPAIGLYNRVDPLGLSLEVTSYFEYGLQNPLLNTDPLGLLVVSPNANCKPKKIRRALEILKRLPTNCDCKRLFTEALGADLPELLEGPSPILKTFGSPSANAGTGGYTPCDGSGEIRIAAFYCRRASPADLAQSILHELAHFADCDKQRFPALGPIEEGGLAEVVCFGRKVDTKPVIKVPFLPLPFG